MLDILNEQLIQDGKKEPVCSTHDCREGICGMCSLYINGHPHGPATGATTCQIYMRRFNDGDTITVEPWRSGRFPVIRDLMVDRTAYDKIMQAGLWGRNVRRMARSADISRVCPTTPCHQRWKHLNPYFLCIWLSQELLLIGKPWVEFFWR